MRSSGWARQADHRDVEQALLADRMRRLREVFGRPVPVTVPKAMTGRLYSGGAALDLAWAAPARDTVPRVCTWMTRWPGWRRMSPS
jgi:hypothetical protein